jgi:hypothetical protein
MNIKGACETCGPMTKEHGYLGHHGKAENLERRQDAVDR